MLRLYDWLNRQLYRANGNDIKKHDPVSYKPDFCVYTQAVNIKCVILIAEFKPTENNSAVESDEVKLSGQKSATLQCFGGEQDPTS